MDLLRHFFCLLLPAALSVFSPAQTPEELASLDPGELYYQAYILVKQAEELEEEGDYLKAFAKYRKARSWFDVISIKNPDFKQREGLKMRIAGTTAAMERIHAQALEQEKARRGRGPNPLLNIPGTPEDNLTVPSQLDPSGAESQRVAEIQDELDKLKSQLESRSNQRDLASAQLRQKIRGLERELSELATLPLRDQVVELHREISRLRAERDAMAAARDKALASQRRTQRQLEATQSALAEARAEEKRLRAVVAKQSKISGELVKGQQEQIEKLKATIAEKDALIAKVNKEAGALRAQLDQSEKMVAELRRERDSLVGERDQMKLLLKMNEADRVQQLITQNVKLSKELNEAKANLRLVEEDASASKDKILFAKQALVVAKAKIQNLQKTNTQAELSLERMEKQLKQTEEDLLNQLNGKELNQRGKAEIAMLRRVVDKYKAKIAAQKGAAELILKESEKLAEKDQAWRNAVAIIKEEQVMELSREEQEVLERSSNPSLTSDIRPSASELAAGTSRLRATTKNLAAVSNRLFSRGDFEAARGTLELIIEQDPGAWEAMVNLGIVQLRLDDPAAASQQFRNAILYAGDRKIPYAHFMLGDSLYRDELFPEAEEELRYSLSLEPENAKAHVLLGIIAGKTDRFDDAEFHFREALTQDPNLYEPLFNLAFLSIKSGNKDEAREFYQQYLQKGGPAQPELEASL